MRRTTGGGPQDFRRFKPADAAAITLVGVKIQQAWRERNFLPAGGGGWTHFSLRDLCHLRLLREFSAGGLPLGLAAKLATKFKGRLQSNIGEEDATEAKHLACIVGDGTGNFRHFGVIGFDELSRMLPDAGRQAGMTFRSLHIYNLADIARDMVWRMELLDDVNAVMARAERYSVGRRGR